MRYCATQGKQDLLYNLKQRTEATAPESSDLHANESHTYANNTEPFKSELCSAEATDSLCAGQGGHSYTPGDVSLNA